MTTRRSQFTPKRTSAQASFSGLNVILHKRTSRREVLRTLTTFRPLLTLSQHLPKSPAPGLLAFDKRSGCAK